MRRVRGRSRYDAGSAHGGRSDLVADLDEFALHAPVSPGRIVRGHTDYELADRSRRGRSSGPPTAGVIPLACDKPPVPGPECRRGHRHHLAPPLPGDQRDSAASHSQLLAATLFAHDLAALGVHVLAGLDDGDAVGLDYWILPQRTSRLGSSLSDHFGCLPARALSAQLTDGADPAAGIQGRRAPGASA